MEFDIAQRHGCKISNGLDEGGLREPKRRGLADISGGGGRLYGWPSSRIVRVSRASGGKDRHSKVLTSKGLRDRRVRLSVNTAIQFYDLQDRLGYDQPSKAVEWLLKAAASSIEELPPMNSVFPGTPKQLRDEKRFEFDCVDVAVNGKDGAGGGQNYRRQRKVARSSACSSPSGASECSGLSLSRSESIIKAKDKKKEKESPPLAGNLNPMSQTTSFTELLSVGLNNLIHSDHDNTAAAQNAVSEPPFFQKSPRQWPSVPMDYFSSHGLLGPPATTRAGPMLLSSSSPPLSSSLFSLTADHHQELQPFFVPDHLVSIVNPHTVEHSDSNKNQHNGVNEYNLNFTASSSPHSSGHFGLNRGTLQSNSTSPSPVRLPPIDGPASFFIGRIAPLENHDHFLSGFDSRLQLCYGSARGLDNGMHSGQKEKEKN